MKKRGDYMSVLKIKDQNGQWTDVLSIKGEKGDNGQDYVLTENDKQEIAQDVAELVDIPVDDVQIDGTSIVQDGVAEIPIANTSNFGVTKIKNGYGIRVSSSNEIIIDYASEAGIKNGVQYYTPIVPRYQHNSVFYGLAKASGDTTQSGSSNAVGTYTDEAKTSIQSMLGVPSEDDVVTDVQINGTSIVSDGVAEIPIARAGGNTIDYMGIVGIGNTNGYYGIRLIGDGILSIEKAPESKIKKGSTESYQPIVPNNQHIATFYGLAKASGDTTQSESNNAVGTYTDEAKSAIQSMLGVPSANDIVGDVQIDGTSIVNDGIAEIPIGNNSQLGAVKGNTSYGINVANGEVRISGAGSNLIKVGSTASKPLTPNTQHESTFYGLAKAAGADEKDSTLPVGQYTDEAKSAIQGMIGIGDFEIIKTVELTEDSAIIEIDTDEAGNPFKLTEMAFLMSMSPSTATTANTNAYIKNRHTTYCATLMSVVRPSATVVHGSIKNIFVSESNNDANFVILNVSNSTQSYWNLKHPTGNEKNYSEYFAVYTTGTSKFGAGTKITLLGRKK